ncbi:MAG: SMP-30/gluconolactonase/LRE family protein [Kiloniellales bacterium]|nr:SMP-30/gluconolactonase/LRE family protein [Kiloniellales bacterium]
MQKVQCVWPAETLLGEAPFWDKNELALYWVDIDGKAVLRWTQTTGKQLRIELDHEIGCIVPRKSGGFIAGLDQGLAYLDETLSQLHIFASPEASFEETRFNDGKCDPRGRFWVGSTDKGEVEPHAALYRVDLDGSVTKVLSGGVVSNGLGWSPDGKTMYFTDSGVRTIYRFDFDMETGSIENRQRFAVVDCGEGIPDGLAVDSHGFVWSAHWDGWRVTRYDPEGRIERVLPMPVPHATSLAFGGESLNLLFITTARLALTGADLRKAPNSGGLFLVEADVCGMPVNSFAG